MSSAAAILAKLIDDLETELGVGPLDPVRPPKQDSTEIVKDKKKVKATKKDVKKDTTKKSEASVVEQAEITKLDVRVGKIVKVWKHEEADKLYCEEIDVGEEEVRKIASGLVHHYSLEEMLDRRVLVLCNLKARNLVGFKSHGMVMCAALPSDNDKEKVEFVEPPIDAKIGERIFFEGLTGEPFTPAQVEKKKVFQNCAEDLKTNSEGIAVWKDHVFMTSAGPCKAPSIKNGAVR